MSWPDPGNKHEHEFKKWVGYLPPGMADELAEFERDANDALKLVVTRPTPASFSWLDRVHQDASPETARFSRDIHLAAHADGVQVKFFPRKDVLVASRNAEREREREAKLSLHVPAPLLEKVPRPLQTKAAQLARKAWNAFPAAADVQPMVEYFPRSAALKVTVECTLEAGRTITFDDLHKFVHGVQAQDAWVECHPDGETLLVCARVKADPVLVAKEEQGEGGGGGDRKRVRHSPEA